MKHANKELDPSSSPEFKEEKLAKVARHKSPTQQVAGSIYSTMAANANASLEETLHAAPNWALKFAQWLSNKVDYLQKEVSSLHLAANFSSETAERAEKLATENRSQINQLTLKFNTLQAEADKLHNRIVNMEAQSRRDNLLFYGLKEKIGETENDLRVWMTGLLTDPFGFTNAEDMKIERIHRKGPIGNPRYRRQNRPVIVKWHSFQTRQLIWESRKKLKNTDIFMAEDYPREIEEKRQRLTPVMKAALWTNC